MSSNKFCFVAMPFRPELNYFYLYIRRHLEDNHGLTVERGDHQILTKPLMEKIRDQILKADVVLGEITDQNPNVFYELGLAHANEKPVIFLTRANPESAPVDIRQYEFIQYDLLQHNDFLTKLDTAIRNVFVDRYRDLYDFALGLLHEFNAATGEDYAAATIEEFQARLNRSEHARETSLAEKERAAESLLPLIFRDSIDVALMRQLTAWLQRKFSESP